MSCAQYQSVQNETSKAAAVEEVQENGDLNIEPVPTDLDPAKTLNEGEILVTTRVGVGYEDGYNGDYNDAVVCFMGRFAVDDKIGTIRSLANQTQDIYIKRNGYFVQNITVGVSHPDGTSEVFFSVSADLENKEERKYPKSLRLGDVFDIKFSIEAGRERLSTLPRTINSKRIFIEVDKCRTGGH